MNNQDRETPTGLSPSADTSTGKKRKLLAGRGVLMFVVAVALLAFALYIFIVLYGILSSG